MEVAFANDKRPESPLKQKGKELLNKIKNWKVPNSFYYFLILIAIGIGFYLVMLAENGFSLAYGGDYSAQYIPMGYHVWDYYHEWIRTGHFTLFDQTIYLGVNSFGSNSYYGLFSPFNIIIVIFPRIIVPQMMAVTSIIKLACAGLFFSIYMHRAFNVKEAVARICGIAYAFAGWGAFYLWYNNYQDILVFFPLVLLGIEKVLKELKPWVLCAGVFFITISNYVLMVPYIICAFLYAMFRFFQLIRTKNAVENLKALGFGFIGFAGGLIMAMFVFGPAFMATLSSPKLDSYSYFGELKTLLLDGKTSDFFKLLFSWKAAKDQHNHVLPTRVLYPIIEFFVPASTCRSLPTLRIQDWDFDDMAVSLWCYIPFIMFLVPALIQSGKEKKWSHFIAFTLLVLTLFTPFMYFLTMGFTNGYARWTLFIASSLIAYVGIYLDKIPNVAKWHMHVGVAFAIIGVVASWLLTVKLAEPDVEVYGKYAYRFLLYLNDGKYVFNFTHLFFILELVYIVGVYLALLFTYNKKAFHILTTVFVAFEAIVMGNLVTWGHGYDDNYNNGYGLNERFRSIYTQIQKNDKSFYRLYTSIGDDWSVNNSMMNNYGSGSFFHSLYNFEVDDFAVYTGMESAPKDVGGHYRGKNQYLDNLLGVKYYFISKKKSKFNEMEKYYPGHYTANVPFDFEKSDKYGTDSKDFIVYENKYLNDFGYTYDSLYNGALNVNVRTSSECIINSINLSVKPLVSQEDSEEITSKYSNITADNIRTNTSSFHLLTESANYDYKFYDVRAVTKNSAENYPFNEIPSIPNDVDEATNYVRYEDNGRSKATDYFAIYESQTTEPLFKANTALYVRAKFSGSVKYNFYFMDQENNIVMFDAHDDDTTDNTSWMRCFYIREDIYRLAVCGKWGESFFLSDSGLENIYFYSEDQAAYEARREAASAQLVKDVKYSPDKFTFTSDFDNNRFVLSRVAYDVGWKIKAKNLDTGKSENIKVYKGNGGFVSFVAPKGNYSYVMEYETPYLAISYLVTALATTSFFVSMVGYHIYQNNKRKHYLDNICREN